MVEPQPKELELWAAAGIKGSASSAQLIAYAVSADGESMRALAGPLDLGEPSVMPMSVVSVNQQAWVATKTRGVVSVRRHSGDNSLREVAAAPTGATIGPSHLTLDNSQRWLIACNCVASDPSVAVLPISASTGAAEAPVCIIPHCAQRTPQFSDAVALRADLRAIGAVQLKARAAQAGVLEDQQAGLSSDALITLTAEQIYRQSKANPHGCCVDPFSARGTNWVHVADLGINALISYSLDQETGQLSQVHEVPLHPGAGPRHVICAPPVGSLRYMYLVNEMDNTVTALRYNGTTGIAVPVQTISTIPDEWRQLRTKQGQAAGYAAEIAVSPCGRFVYASNRGHNSIVVYECRAEADPDAPLVVVEHVPSGGATPWGFSLFGPEGCFVAVSNQWAECLADEQSDGGGMLGSGVGNVSIFQRDLRTGQLRRTAAKVELEAALAVAAPVVPLVLGCNSRM